MPILYSSCIDKDNFHIKFLALFKKKKFFLILIQFIQYDSDFVIMKMDEIINLTF